MVLHYLTPCCSRTSSATSHTDTRHCYSKVLCNTLWRSLYKTSNVTQKIFFPIDCSLNNPIISHSDCLRLLAFLRNNLSDLIRLNSSHRFRSAFHRKVCWWNGGTSISMAFRLDGSPAPCFSISSGRKGSDYLSLSNYMKLKGKDIMFGGCKVK